MTKLENALIWLYAKTWGEFGNHVVDEKDLWKFGVGDLETAIMSIAYPRKRGITERVQALTDLIMEKFEGGAAAFREWSGELHDKVIATFPETSEPKTCGKYYLIS